MAQTNFGERRRTERVQIAIPLMVRGKNGSESFQEATHTIAVNIHGGIVRLAANVIRSQKISIFNPKTTEELACTVSFVGQKNAGKADVGIEFSTPAAAFWRITFPPADWNPSDRKQYKHNPQRPT